MHSDTKLVVGPANHSGQATAWARAVSNHLNIPASSFSYRASRLRGKPDIPFGWEVDASLPDPAYPYFPFRYRAVRAALEGSSHLLLDGYKSLFGRVARADLVAEVERLEARGVTVGLLAHGSDVRDPDRHMANVSDSFFREAPEAWVKMRRVSSRQNREHAARSGVPLFVSTPDLLVDLPNAKWLPLALNPGWIIDHRPRQVNPRPTVLHMPSKRMPPIKGTDSIEPVLARLDSAGLIDWIRANNVPNREMPALYRRADIVIDQVASGGYGLATVEALSQGCVVIGQIDDETRRLAGVSIPVINATRASLETVLTELVGDTSSFEKLRHEGLEFVEMLHSGRSSALAMRDFLSA